MRKIGLVTFFENNYGSILQCFATKTFVESLNYKCDVLSEYNPKRLIRKIITKLRLCTKSFFYCEFRKEYIKRAKAHGTGSQNLCLESKNLLDAFVKRYLSPVEYHNNSAWKREYDLFMTGSDQIWDSTYLFEAFSFLMFASRQKRIALAPSFGTSEIPKYNQRALRKALAGFDYISVREETGVNIVKKYSNAKVCRIADPTFIYDADEWRGFAKDGAVISQKYVLVHFLNEPNEVALESMSWLSEQLNIDVVAIGYRHDSFNRLKRFVFKDGGPWDYVSMIDKAEYVITDSFHSSLFSINFNKRFFVFHRNYLASKQTSRISDLLERFGMGNRLITDIEVLKNLYLENLPVSSRSILEKERATIRDYIQKSISGQVPRCFMTENNG